MCVLVSLLVAVVTATGEHSGVSLASSSCFLACLYACRHKARSCCSLASPGFPSLAVSSPRPPLSPTQVKQKNGNATYFFRDHALVQGLFVDTSSYNNASLTYFTDPAVSRFVFAANLTGSGASATYGATNCTYKGLTGASLAECQAAIAAEDQRRNVVNEYSTDATIALFSNAIVRAKGEAAANSLRRRLAIGDFDALNEIFDGVSFSLPDISTTVSGINLDIRKL